MYRPSLRPPTPGSPTRWLGALLTVLAAAATATAGDLEDAQRLRAAGKYEQALAKFEQAAEAEPGNPDVVLGLSETLFGLGRFEPAGRAVPADMVEAHPDRMDLLLAKARAYVSAADQGAADGADPSLILGLAADGDRWLKVAVEREPAHPEARVLTARVLQHQGGPDTAEAVALLEAVSKDSPGYFDGHFALGDYWMNHARRNGQAKPSYARAEQAFLAAAKADPKSGEALLRATWARQWQAQTGPVELVVAYEKAAALMPERSEPLVQMLKLYRGAAMPQVQESFERLHKARPKDKVLAAYRHTLLGYDLANAGKGDEAVKHFEQGVPLLEDYHDLVYTWVEYTASRPDSKLTAKQREAVWTALWKQWPTQWRGANNAGLYYRDNVRDYEKSRDWYVRAAEHAVSSPQVLQDTGLVLHQYLKQADKAEPYFRRAIEAAEQAGYEGQELDEIDRVGHYDALNNLAKLLIEQKRWKDLQEFVEQHVPEDDPRHATWLRVAAGKGKG